MGDELENEELFFLKPRENRIWRGGVREGVRTYVGLSDRQNFLITFGERWLKSNDAHWIRSRVYPV